MSLLILVNTPPQGHTLDPSSPSCHTQAAAFVFDQALLLNWGNPWVCPLKTADEQRSALNKIHRTLGLAVNISYMYLYVYLGFEPVGGL
jgi:hypothetical protein